MRLLALSPHADDAVWSLGGFLGMLAPHMKVCVVTIYDGDPTHNAAVTPAQAWRGLRGTTLRRMEDAKAAGMLGLEQVGLGELDAAFRQDADGEFVHAGLKAVFPGYEVLKTLPLPPWADRLAALVEADDVVIAPMAFGRHVDHYLTFLAARSLPPDKVMFYAEFPYWNRADATAVHGHLAALDLALSMVEVPVPWETWCAGACAYRSQVLRMFGRKAEFVAQLERFAGRREAQASCPIWVNRCL